MRSALLKLMMAPRSFSYNTVGPSKCGNNLTVFLKTVPQDVSRDNRLATENSFTYHDQLLVRCLVPSIIVSFVNDLQWVTVVVVASI